MPAPRQTIGKGEARTQTCQDERSQHADNQTETEEKRRRTATCLEVVRQLGARPVALPGGVHRHEDAHVHVERDQLALELELGFLRGSRREHDTTQSGSAQSARGQRKIRLSLMARGNQLNHAQGQADQTLTASERARGRCNAARVHASSRTACWMVRICCAMTESTLMCTMLNSSKHAHAPAWSRNQSRIEQ